MFPVVEKKTLMKNAPPRVQIGLLVVCSEKKETRKPVDRGAYASQSLIQQKKQVPKTANMAKALKKAKVPRRGCLKIQRFITLDVQVGT